ncbi:MAG: thiamine phosphate synthase [SAR202 cluster bacterium]|nr:thiamine phosphate synthase [SAR202 cluster bacterium]
MVVTRSSLHQLHLDSLRHDCAILSAVAENLLHNAAIARQIHDLNGRLPGPTLDQPKSSALTPEQALKLVVTARSSLDLLSSAGHFSQLGERLAGGLHATLDTLESQLGHRSRDAARQKAFGLYVIIDPQATAGRDPLHVTRDALDGGARMVQLRDKARDKGQSLPLARAMKQLCDEKDALFIVNDHADITALCDAHGVHLGLTDLPVAEARKALHPHQLIGRSNHHLEEALEASQAGADYIAVGAMFPTSSKDQPIVGGPMLLKKVKGSVDVPVVAIGGITAERVAEVVRAGADALCVISAVGLAPSPRDAAARLVESIRAAGGRV